MEGMTSSNGADSYMTILNKRIRAYKKKIERINVLKEKENLEPEQKELCSHLEVYSAILKELYGIKAQFLQLYPEVVPFATPEGDSPVVEDAPAEVKEEVNETVEVEDKQVDPIAESVPEETPMESHEELREETREESHEGSHEESHEESREEPLEDSHKPIAEPKEATQPVEAEAPQPANKSSETKKHYPNRRRGTNDEHRHFPRGGRNPMNKRGPRPNISRKDREDGWTIPKKVVHVKN